MAKIDDSVKKKVPELRFPGFADNWEERKLTEIVNRVNKSSNSDVLPKVEFEDIVSGEGRLNKDISSKFDSRKGTLFEPENILYGKLRPYLKNWLFSDFEGVALGDFWVFEATDVSVPSFDYYLIQSDNYQKVANDTSGTKMPRSDWKNVSSTDFAIPSKDEQKQIGAFFKQLDNTIVLHQRRLDLLKEQKKGYLQKMFPKNGAKVPELRFAGFADDWEERKLSDLFIKGGSGGTPKSTNKAFYDGDIPFLGISDITKSNGFINNTEKHISSDGLNSSAAWIVSKGAISLAMYASVGKLAILNIDAATSQAFYNMIFDDYDLRDLVYQRLNKANELSEWNKLISTGTQSNLNADKVKNFQMYLPKNHDEIKLISTFFKQIDNTIALHQRKLDLLKEQKKGFLQKMFV